MKAFTELLRSLGRTAFGTWAKLPTCDSVELLAVAGFDFIAIDMEHAPLDIRDVHQLIGAARGRDLPALVRVPDRSPTVIARVLDSGAAGVLVPHVDHPGDAVNAVAAARFPPLGTRGFGPTVRAGGWGTDTAAYRASAASAAVIPQLESRAAIADMHRIGATDGLDALFVGPADLAVATGLTADAPEFRALLNTAERTAAELGIPLGTATGASAADAAALAHRYQFVLLANDATLLTGAASELLTATKKSLTA